MKKKIFLFAALAIMFTGRAFAQTHWASLEVKGLGAGLRYEYVINPSFTVGGYFSWTWFTLIPFYEYEQSIEFGATARWYPFARRFFAELSLGYNTFWYYDPNYNNSYYYNSGDWREGVGFCITPGFGWTIDLGRMGGFFLAPGIKFPITIGYGIIVVPYVGLGIAF